ncbi:hypothetical protein ACFLSW_03200 [Candidatus Bipolaricaulota bacterium]
MNLSRNAQRWIDRYLRRVGRALRHLDPMERREIVDGLRAHIHEGLAERGADPVRMDDVRAVLSTMDNPQGFGKDDAIEASIQTGRGLMFGRLGFYFLLAGLVLSVLALTLGATVADALFRGGLILSGVLIVCALGLGIAGWRSPLGKVAIICSVLVLASAAIFIPARVTSSGPGSPQPVVEMQTPGGD